MRIARGDGRRLCLLPLARAACAPGRPEIFFVAAVVFFDPAFGDGLPVPLDNEVTGFFGTDEESEV
jgi:hypothetical protein